MGAVSPLLPGAAALPPWPTSVDARTTHEVASPCALHFGRPRLSPSSRTPALSIARATSGHSLFWSRAKAMLPLSVYLSVCQVYVKSALMDHVVPMGIRAPADNSSYGDPVIGRGNSASIPGDMQQLIDYPFFGEQDKFVGSSFAGLPLEYLGT